MTIGSLVNGALGALGLKKRKFDYDGAGDAIPDLAAALGEATEMAHDRSLLASNPLMEIFERNQRGDTHKWLHYFEVYDHWFSRYRDKPDLAMLEIGVFKGGSLKMWREYFHADATIVGLDIDKECVAFADPEKKVFVEIGSQSDQAVLKRVLDRYGPFDIIIDDGGHMTSQMIDSFNFLYAGGLKEEGVYLVEDTHTNYWRHYRDTERSFIDLAKALVDRLHEPYIGASDDLPFRDGEPNQLKSLKVSRFAATTPSISFYDSIVVFHKRRRSLPISELR